MGSMAGCNFHLVKKAVSERDNTGRSRSKTVYYARFFSSRYPDGRARYEVTRSTGESNKAAATKRANEMITNKEVVCDVSRETLQTYLGEFWERNSDYVRNRQIDSGRTYSESYLAMNRSFITDYVLPWMRDHGIEHLHQITRETLKAWRLDLAEGKIVRTTTRRHSRSARSLSPVTLNKIRQALWVPLQYAADEGMIPDHPGKTVGRIGEHEAKRNSMEQRANKVLTQEEILQLFRTAHWIRDEITIRAYAVALLCLSVGMRQGEARGLQWKNVDLERRLLDIRTNYQDEEGLKPPKLGSVRVGIPLGAMAYAALKFQHDNYPYENPTPEDFVFPSSKSRQFPIHSHTLNKALSLAAKSSGIAEKRKGLGFHDLRHTWASHSSTTLPEAVRKFALGHRNGDITELYTHATEQYRPLLLNFQNSMLDESGIDDYLFRDKAEEATILLLPELVEEMQDGSKPGD